MPTSHPLQTTCVTHPWLRPRRGMRRRPDGLGICSVPTEARSVDAAPSGSGTRAHTPLLNESEHPCTPDESTHHKREPHAPCRQQGHGKWHAPKPRRPTRHAGARQHEPDDERSKEGRICTRADAAPDQRVCRLLERNGIDEKLWQPPERRAQACCPQRLRWAPWLSTYLGSRCFLSRSGMAVLAAEGPPTSPFRNAPAPPCGPAALV